MCIQHNEILLSHEKEWYSHTCNNIDKSWRHQTKWNKPDTKGDILYDSTYTWHTENRPKKKKKGIDHLKRRSRLVVSRGWGGLNRQLLFNCYRVSV